MESDGDKVRFNFSSLRRTFKKESDTISTYSEPLEDTKKKHEESDDDDRFSITHRNRPQKIYRSIKKKFKSVLCRSKPKVTAAENKCSQIGFVNSELLLSVKEVSFSHPPAYYPPVPPRKLPRAISESMCTSARLSDYEDVENFVTSAPNISPRNLSINPPTVPPRCLSVPPLRCSSQFNIKNAAENELLPSNTSTCSIPDSYSVTDGLNRTFGSDYSSLKRCGYYWGPISRQEAENKLNSEPDGTFLVRDSSSDNYLFSLAFRSWGRTLHSRIEYAGGTYSICDQHGFKTIVELIEKVMNRSDNTVYCYSRSRSPTEPDYPVRLIYPLSRLTMLHSLKHKCRYVIRESININDIDTLPLPAVLKEYLREERYF